MVWRSTVTWAVNLFSCATELCSILDPGNMDPLFHVRKVCASTPARSCWMWVKPLGARFYLLTFLSTGAPQSTTKPRISDMGRLQVEASMPKTFLTNLVAVQQNAKPIRWWATLLSLKFSWHNEQKTKFWSPSCRTHIGCMCERQKAGEPAR